MDPISRSQAQHEGRKKFFTGKPCAHGHVAQRYVSTGACVVCLKSSVNEWRKEATTAANQRLKRLFVVKAHPDDHAALFALAQALALDRGVILTAEPVAAPAAPQTRSRELIQQDRARILGVTLATAPEPEPPALGN